MKFGLTCQCVVYDYCCNRSKKACALTAGCRLELNMHKPQRLAAATAPHCSCNDLVLSILLAGTAHASACSARTQSNELMSSYLNGSIVQGVCREQLLPF